MEKFPSNIDRELDIIEIENNIDNLYDDQIFGLIDLYKDEPEYQEIADFLRRAMANRIIEMPNSEPVYYNIGEMPDEQIEELIEIYDDKEDFKEARQRLIQEMARRIIEYTNYKDINVDDPDDFV